MTKEIFTLVAGLVIAFITANTAGLSKVLGHPANLFAIFFLIILALVAFAEDKDADANRLSTWLKRRDGPLLYTRAVQGLLRGLDRLMMPKTAAGEPMPTKGFIARWNWLATPRAKDAADLDRLRQNPWSWPVFDAALKLAIAYPILLAMAQWAATGDATGLGGATVFSEEPRDWLRAALFVPIATFLVLRFLAAATSRRIFESATTWSAVFAFVGAFVVGGLSSVAGNVAGALAVALAGAFAVAGAFAFAFAVAFAAAFAVAGVLAFIASFAVVGATAVTFALAAALAGAFPAAFAVAHIITFTLLIAVAAAGAVAGAVAGAGAVATVPARFTCVARGGRGYALFTVGLLAILLAIPLLVGFPAENATPSSVWLFLGLLPVLNAIFDWLSYGLTIWLIREGNRRKGLWTLVYGLIDAVSAVILFFALSLTLTCVIGWSNLALPVPVVDLPALFAGLADPTTRGTHFWVAGMIFSTLVPTVVHLVIVGLSVITWVPPHLRHWCEAGIGLRHVSGQAFTLSAILVSLLYAAYALILTWGLFKLAGTLMTGLSAAIPWYLWLVATCARTLGAM